jgi:hypothetical protein
MHRIKAISKTMLDEKLVDAAVPADDMHTKKDIMSLLVKARKAETMAQEKSMMAGEAVPGGLGYTMSDEMIMNQVVSTLPFSKDQSDFSLAYFSRCWS